jgi:CheY-like chemotaxis protein
VLHYIKTADAFRHIPVIMLTTSSSFNDINSSYLNHANCYITKPVEVEEFFRVVLQLENFWVNVVKLPT